MKKKWQSIVEKITWKRIIVICICLCFLFVAIILHGVRVHLVKQLKSQNVVSRWSEENDWAQISSFFSVREDIQPEKIMQIRYTIQQKLKEESITVTDENSSARLYVDCYSANGEVVATNEENSFSGNAYGIGGDYFIFHPLNLIYGNYFSESDLLDDYVIVDKEIAWKLFGSSNVVGEYISIQNIPHMIIGVYERDSDSMNQLAGNGEPTMYLSYHSLANYGTNRGIKTYEIILQNPVTGFAKKFMDEVLAMDEDSVSMVENSSRYQLSSLWGIIRSFPVRSMSMNGIIYPFWENIARGYEDVAVRLLKFEMVCFIIPFIYIVFLCLRIRKAIVEKLRERKNKKLY